MPDTVCRGVANMICTFCGSGKISATHSIHTPAARNGVHQLGYRLAKGDTAKLCVCDLPGLAFAL